MESERFSEKLNQMFATNTTDGYNGSAQYLSGASGQHMKLSYLTNAEEPETAYMSHVDILKGIDVRSLSRNRRISSKSTFSIKTLHNRESSLVGAPIVRENLETNFHSDDYS